MITVDVDEAARVARPQVTIPWFVLAPVGALAVAAAGWLLMAGPAALGWLTSPESQLADALGLASRVLLLANGAVTTIGGQPVSIAPLGLTLVLILLGVPVAGLAARAAIDETDDLRGLVLRVGGTYAGTYVVFTTLIAFFVPETSAIRAFLGSALVGGLSGFWGVTRAVGYNPCERWPVRLRPFPRGIGVAVLICVGTGAALLAAVLILGRDRIAAIADGLGCGANARAALVTRGLREITRLATALGAQEETLTGLAGMGDLVLTCTDDQSRNRRFGLALGRGESAAAAKAAIGQVVEGEGATHDTYALAQQHGIRMPITEHLHHMLAGSRSLEDTFASLLARNIKQERH